MRFSLSLVVLPIQTIASDLPRDFVYELLTPPLPLIVDVGAADGEITRKLRLLGDDDTRVVAFEPYPPNIRYFESTTKDLDSVVLVTKAVSDVAGPSVFFVPSRVSGSEPGWENRVGYSSVGHIARSSKDHIASLLRRTERIRVQTTTLDDEFHVPISFLKVDVQGAESHVLRGAQHLLSNHLIHMAYVEWSGDPEVISTLARHRYRTYDSHYIGWSALGPSVFEEEGFEVVDETDLSIGQRGLIMINLDPDPGRKMRRINSMSDTWIQTDLISVPPERQLDFESRFA